MPRVHRTSETATRGGVLSPTIQSHAAHPDLAMLRNVESLVGIGLYTVPEAARLTKVPQQAIRRWQFGYSYRRNGEEHTMAPVWEGQVPRINSAVGLGFLDLMEVRFVRAFRIHGVSLHVIRLAADRAREIFDQHHPFARKKFMTDGRRIFAEIVEESGETWLLDMVKSQYAFERVIRPTLYHSVEFSAGDEALRWYPMWPGRQVVVDPQQSFGRPVTVEGRVPTDTLAAAVKAESSVARVARLFDLPKSAVRAAVTFEQSLAA